MGNKKDNKTSTLLVEVVSEIQLAIKRGGSISGIPTDYIDMDRLLGGFQNGDLIVLAGRTSMGKTALALNFAYNAAKFFDTEFKKGEDKKRKSVGFFSLEMSSDKIIARILSRETCINARNFKTGEIEKEDFDRIFKTADEISRLPLIIEDFYYLSIPDIRKNVVKMIEEGNLSILFIDYLQLIKGVEELSKTNKSFEVSEIMKGLKSMAQEFQIPIVIVSQISRQVEQREDKRPQLIDFTESASIEQDADVVMFIYREEYYEERKKPMDGDSKVQAWIVKMEKLRNKAEIIVAKHRNGPIGNVVLRFDSALGRFQDYAGQYDKAEE